MLNSVCLQGRLTADPELKTTQSGVSMLTFTVAWSKKYKEIESKCFLRCKAWRSTAEFISKYFKKGQEIVVDGELTTEEWEDNGTKKSMNVLSVGGVHFCGSANSSSGTSSNTSQNNFTPIEEDPNLPF